MSIQSIDDIRQSFIDFFIAREHQHVPSSQLVPKDDPTLLFTNSGMVQFKNLFLGHEKRAYQRAVTAQCCVRAGGKHNDLENVGYTARHHTFFEMLGNFSFGDYFKQEAIQYAWEYLTQVLKLPPQKLWITVYKDDDEAARIWLDDIKVDADRFSYCGDQDNFWTMGETGPCGPCSEIFYDHGEHIDGGPPGTKNAEADRYVEIWNLVFTQFNRSTDGQLTAIPHPSVDTGMGLERIAAVMQGVHNNYDIDLFQHLIQAIQSSAKKDDADLIASRVIADHIRSCTFLIADGVLPSNEGRGYVLRRIIRRAIRYGLKLEFEGLHSLVPHLVAEMGHIYPQLESSKTHIAHVLKTEEAQFQHTLVQGLKVLDEVIANTEHTINGQDVFRLYDTYGFPMDLTADVAKERNMSIDVDGFHQAMTSQRQRARANSQFSEIVSNTEIDMNIHSVFSGYDCVQQPSKIISLYQNGQLVDELQQGEMGGVVLSATPFYAESGGQVGDKGELTADNALFEVQDTQKQGQYHIHLGMMQQGTFKVEQAITALVNSISRHNIMRNHSATHLLHAALRKLLGEHVQQKGSLVTADHLRFDYTHSNPLSRQELDDIEALVNHYIMKNIATDIQLMSLEQAKQSGAISLFGEKYADEVRVLNIADGFSHELCGGTHVMRTGDIGCFQITQESSIAAGIRRIEAVTGEGALAWINQVSTALTQVADILKTDKGSVLPQLNIQLEKKRSVEKELMQIKHKLASNISHDIAKKFIDVEFVHSAT